MVYTGIGSRQTPYEFLDVFKNIGKYLAKEGWILRSGGANGADSYFEGGCDLENGKKEIYLPWKGFNGNESDLYRITEEGKNLAKHYHPYWDNLKDASKKLQTRNCYQVLGHDLNTPTNLIICYTKNGKMIGGTAQALRIAKDYNIKVFNAGAYKSVNEFREELWKYLKTLKRSDNKWKSNGKKN